MAFGREKGLLALGLLSEPQHRSEMSDQAPVPADPAPLNAADIPVVAVAAPVNNGAGLVTTDTVSPRVAVVETALPVLCNTEQDNAAPRLILDDADYDEQHRRSDEAEDESDYHGDDVPLDAFDGDSFLDAMRSENLFDSVRADDVNFVKNADSNCSESEADDDDNGDNDSSKEGVDDVEDLDSDEEMDYTFDMAPEDLRQLGSTGWKTYDEDHSGKSAIYRISIRGQWLTPYLMYYVADIRLDAADDYYTGPSGPTRSAVAFADSPLGMFFYFLPKAMWKRIADESNHYREQRSMRWLHPDA
ncbi:hypothetical protein DVH05_026859 [Phytophthora capsici]|nr:hypothetical protein DVH05_026859 [Phytophthora capsici]